FLWMGSGVHRAAVTTCGHRVVLKNHFVRKSLKRNSHSVHVLAALTAALVLAALAGCKSQVGGDVMASVDGRKIYASDVQKYFENQTASAENAPTGEQSTTLRLNILHE